jgi:hypothetical protein
VYVTSDERIRLGLQGYGSDVPEEVVEAAEAALNGGCPLPVPKAAARKRARTARGTLQGDDPATPDVDEAWEG